MPLVATEESAPWMRLVDSRVNLEEAQRGEYKRPSLQESS